jgi:hypothetical protein
MLLNPLGIEVFFLLFVESAISSSLQPEQKMLNSLEPSIQQRTISWEGFCGVP